MYLQGKASYSNTVYFKDSSSNLQGKVVLGVSIHLREQCTTSQMRISAEVYLDSGMCRCAWNEI